MEAKLIGVKTLVIDGKGYIVPVFGPAGACPPFDCPPVIRQDLRWFSYRGFKTLPMQDFITTKKGPHKMKWEDWVTQLKQIAVEIYEFTDYGVEKTDWEAYRSYYEDGYSPDEAMMEDMNYGEHPEL